MKEMYTSRLFDSKSLSSPHAFRMRSSLPATKLGYSNIYLKSSNSFAVSPISPLGVARVKVVRSSVASAYSSLLSVTSLPRLLSSARILAESSSKEKGLDT